MKKYETQSLALDGCSQVSLSMTRTSQTSGPETMNAGG